MAVTDPTEGSRRAYGRNLHQRASLADPDHHGSRDLSQTPSCRSDPHSERTLVELLKALIAKILGTLPL